FRRGVFMLQKEVADRLVANPGDEPYGFLTLYRELFATARIVLKLDPGSFHPRPKVRSAVVVLDPDRKPYASEELLDFISRALRMRRKKLVNNLAGWHDLTRDRVLEGLRRVNLDPHVRAEEMSADDFARLLQAVC